jgi:hypothetical protein
VGVGLYDLGLKDRKRQGVAGEFVAAVLRPIEDHGRMVDRLVAEGIAVEQGAESLVSSPYLLIPGAGRREVFLAITNLVGSAPSRPGCGGHWVLGVRQAGLGLVRDCPDRVPLVSS